MKVRADYLSSEDFLKAAKPGSFTISEPNEDGEQDFRYRCACGCGYIGTILIGKGFKPSTTPSWKWNGSIDHATLEPSIHHVGHWHGWLTNGEWYDV